MITEYNRLSGLQKVAILFSVLGESLAMNLVQDISKTDIRKIRSTIRELDQIAFSVKKQVMEEFYFSFLSEDFQEKEEGPIEPFAFLESLTDEQINGLATKENTRVVAVLLAQLPSEKRISILNKMAPEDKGEVLLDLGNLDNIPLEGIIEVANKLREKSHFLPKTVDFSRGGGKDIAEIIGLMAPEEEEKYLSAIQNENPELFKEIKKYHLAFDDIFEIFPDNIIRDLMNSVELDTLALALKGVDQEKVDRVIENLPQKKQAMYESVEGAVSKRDIDGARKEITTAAKKMEADGAFNLADMLGGSEMVE
ncbi:MAG: hypothetical protein HN657_05725 [Candidatus Marinimicrobia bacterium]|jgi:flagellar motor switch protein FliG|nr:hypothetical protein [Candidatus Neomarinimicrobiota bacterium]MBT3495565.1 hypothetical protein [Candidatus Neomarinimicrobiota bacterium]MBT3732573.1 hypothetical protein [Candidatus Neomarinimicrobiota bacterium]MBT4144382.1 hypothetical protein [Candidatus Neomarinimicrobiota bacterium]MBT4177449.1 hypothetical protein [Candidatus Neomarinimicrobiota bacterium]